jgi:carbonic anhydrase
MAREPARGLVIITCMDARVDPLAILRLRLGDAHVIRNAGGAISHDVLRSLRVSHSQLGTHRALIIGHTDCAAHGSDEAAETAVTGGMRRIRNSGVVGPAFVVEGLMYDLRTGAVEKLA